MSTRASCASFNWIWICVILDRQNLTFDLAWATSTKTYFFLLFFFFGKNRFFLSLQILLFLFSTQHLNLHNNRQLSIYQVTQVLHCVRNESFKTSYLHNLLFGKCLSLLLLSTNPCMIPFADVGVSVAFICIKWKLLPFRILSGLRTANLLKLSSHQVLRKLINSCS